MLAKTEAELALQRKYEALRKKKVNCRRNGAWSSEFLLE